MARSNTWRYSVCGMLMLATMLNYMDRQTLSQLAKTILDQYSLERFHYGRIELGFGLAFAFGGLFFGFLADKVSVRWLYPFVLVGWSVAGMMTAYASEIGAWIAPFLPQGEGTMSDETRHAFLGFMACRIALGIFEAGHWPCALVTTQAILTRENRSLGNSILQSGAAIGAIFTPLIVLALIGDDPTRWRVPFLLIGLIGVFWVVPWLALVRDPDLVRKPEEAEKQAASQGADSPSWMRRFVALCVVVITINLTWQFFRAWLPLFLEEVHGYSLQHVAYFISAYYISTDVGCLAVGAAVKGLANRGWGVHSARMVTFAVSAGLVFLSVLVAFLPAGPLLLGLLLVVGAGSLGLFPNYYAFTQELSSQHQGKVTGILSFITWVFSAFMQEAVGQYVTATKSYVLGIIMAGVVPLFGLIALWLLWGKSPLSGQPKAYANHEGVNGPRAPSADR